MSAMSAPIYLYTGPEAGQKNEHIAAQKEELKKKYGSSDDYTYYGTDLQMPEVLAQLMTDSLFIPATSVVIRNAEFIKDKKDIDAIASWGNSFEKNKKDSTILILVSDELKVDSKLEKLVPPANKKVFWEMFEDRKEQWLMDFFKKNGYSIQIDAVSLILEMVQNNTESLKNECSRFFMCLPAGHCITETDVEQILSHNREESAFSLFDAMLEDFNPQKKFENCLSILQKLKLSSSRESELSGTVISGLSYCFRKVALWQMLHQQNAKPSDQELKAAGFSSKTFQKQYSKAARVWTPGQVAAIEAVLAKTDVEIRSSGNVFQFTLLVLMIYEIVVKKGAYCAKYETAL